MNTFLPLPDFEKSALSLNKRRCWKQVVEAAQLISAIEGKNRWKYHPACKMWQATPNALKMYFNVFLDVCLQTHKIHTIYSPFLLNKVTMPWWFGNEEFHYRQRCNLLRKALEDMTKGKNELTENLAKQGIFIEGHNLSLNYVWLFADGTRQEGRKHK